MDYTNNDLPTTSGEQRPLTKACTYRRARGADGSTSRLLQAAVLEQLAAQQGYEIVASYHDVGSGASGPAKRPGLAQMLADAATAQWEVVLCADLTRLTRLDSFDDPLLPLRKAGKRLHTVQDGLCDWHTAEGRLIDAWRSEFATTEQEYKRRRRWLLDTIVAKPPYAMSLVPGDPAEVAIVQWLFKAFASNSDSLHHLANDLNARQIAGPRRGRWTRHAVLNVLRNRAYVDDPPHRTGIISVDLWYSVRNNLRRLSACH